MAITAVAAVAAIADIDLGGRSCGTNSRSKNYRCFRFYYYLAACLVDINRSVYHDHIVSCFMAARL